MPAPIFFFSCKIHVQYFSLVKLSVGKKLFSLHRQFIMPGVITSNWALSKINSKFGRPPHFRIHTWHIWRKSRPPRHP